MSELGSFFLHTFSYVLELAELVELMYLGSFSRWTAALGKVTTRKWPMSHTAFGAMASCFRLYRSSSTASYTYLDGIARAHWSLGRITWYAQLWVIGFCLILLG
jgi:hypothetical protein